MQDRHGDERIQCEADLKEIYFDDVNSSVWARCQWCRSMIRIVFSGPVTPHAPERQLKDWAGLAPP